MSVRLMAIRSDLLLRPRSLRYDRGRKPPYRRTLLRRFSILILWFFLFCCREGSSDGLTRGTQIMADSGSVDMSIHTGLDTMTPVDGGMNTDATMDASQVIDAGAEDMGTVDMAVVDGEPGDAEAPAELRLRTAFGDPEQLEVRTNGIYAIWWDPRFDHEGDTELMFRLLNGIREDCLENLGLEDPPNPPAGDYYNVYIHHGEDDDFPNGWGNGQGTDPFGMPFCCQTALMSTKAISITRAFISQPLQMPQGLNIAETHSGTSRRRLNGTAPADCRTM